MYSETENYANALKSARSLIKNSGSKDYSVLLDSVTEHAEKLPALTRHFLVKSQTELRKINVPFNYEMDMILDISGGGSSIGGNLGVYLFPRIKSEEVFFQQLKRWQHLENYNIARIFSVDSEPLIHLDHDWFVISDRAPTHRLYNIRRFRKLFEKSNSNEIEVLSKLISASIEYTIWYLSGSFDITQRNFLVFSDTDDRPTYEIVENTAYEFPWD